MAKHKRFYRENFWQLLESSNMDRNKIAIQELIYEDFNIQVGTKNIKDRMLARHIVMDLVKVFLR